MCAFISKTLYPLGCLSPNKESSSLDGDELIPSDMHARDDKLHVNHSAQDGYSRLAQTSSATSSQTSLHSSLEQNDKENHTQDIVCEVGSGQVRSIANKNLTDEVSGVKRKHSESEMSDMVCYFIVSSRGLRGFKLFIWKMHAEV